MKTLILILLFSIPLLGMSQKLIEVSLNNEDKAIGLNYIDADNHFIVGAENGTYKYDRAKVEHWKYKLGYSFMMEKILHGQNNLIIAASPCYNKYNVVYNDDQMKHMPEWSFELSARTNFSDRIYLGLQWDFVQKSGGFNISFVIFK